MPDENQLELFQPQTTNYSGFCLLNVPAGGNRSPDIKICSKPGTVGVFQYLSTRLPVPHFRPFGTA